MKKEEFHEIKQKFRDTINNPIIKLFYEKEKNGKKGSKKWTTLTKIQLETLVIDLIADEVNPELSYYDRAKIRKVTKRSFYHTLEQARLNLIRAIFTVLLAGSLNIIDTPRLSDFNDLAQNFADLIRVNNLEDKKPEEKDKWINIYTKMIFEQANDLKKQSALSKD